MIDPTFLSTRIVTRYDLNEYLRDCGFNECEIVMYQDTSDLLVRVKCKSEDTRKLQKCIDSARSVIPVTICIKLEIILKDDFRELIKEACEV